MSLRTGNPLLGRVGKLNEKEKESGYDDVLDTASYGGVAAKTGILLAIAAISAYIIMFAFLKLNLEIEVYCVYLVACIIGALITSILSSFVKMCKVCGILYSFFEGALIGFVSLIINVAVPGAAIIALTATFSVCAISLMLYSARIVKVSNRFLKALYTVMLALVITSLVTGIFYWINPSAFTISWPLAILISVVYIIIATANLFADFRRTEDMVEQNVSKKYEWMMATGLVATILWLYVEILRLVAILASKKD